MKTKEATGFVEKVHSMVDRLQEAISLLYNAFIYSKNTPLELALEQVESVKAEEKELTPQLVDLSGTDELARLYAPVPGHLERIASNIEHMIRVVKQKNEENILFSDKAVSEINFLINRVKEVLSNLSDLVLARNRYLANYIIESEAEIERTANEFSTLHEERLIEGLCMPKASGIYVILLDGLKRIVWNAKEIASKLS
ncbi:MAG: hypothetical protein D6710_11220 [Nitrospirae bacterium]|nr:MAG: hypothetical protein D6710_11220 [Nitrospirota bacterium]